MYRHKNHSEVGAYTRTKAKTSKSLRTRVYKDNKEINKIVDKNSKFLTCFSVLFVSPHVRFFHSFILIHTTVYNCIDLKCAILQSQYHILVDLYNWTLCYSSLL